MATKKKRPARRSARIPDAYSMPALSPLYPRPPYEYRDAWSQLILFRSDPRRVAKYVPKPLVPDPNGLMSLLTSRFFASGFGSYYEVTLCARASFQRRPVNFTLYLLLDNDIAIGGGREIWGWPKKYGRIELSEQDAVVCATAERGGVPLVRASMHLSELVPADQLAGPSEWVTLKIIPSVADDAPPDVMQLTLTPLTNFVVRNVFRGDGTLEFFPSPADRFHTIPVREVLDAYYYNSDFTLPGGEVIHDYLA
jgi:acetoacetate decarboxylase